MKNIKGFCSYIAEKHYITRFLVFSFAIFIMGIVYNGLILPNQFNIGGTGGVAVLVQHLFGIEPSLFIFIFCIVLLLFSFLFLGVKQSCRSVVGAFLYPLSIKYTAPIAAVLVPHLQFDNLLITLTLAAILNGVACGLVYRVGFTSGGMDILMKILVKYYHITEGTASRILNSIVVLAGGFILGVPSLIYSVFMIVITSYFIDRVLIGISSSKMFFVYSKKSEQIKEYALQVMHTGATIFHSEGGFMKKKRKILMVVVSTSEYYAFRTAVLEIDPDAFFVISDCYEVNGGYKRENFPF